MQQQPERAVSAEHAWRAALTRAQRGTEALIVAEAQILELEGQLAQAGSEIERLRREAEQLQEQPEPGKVVLANGDEVACWHTEPGSPCDWNVCRQKGVKTDAAEDQEQPAEAEREAVSPPPFSD